jgi:hypothetical protein
MTTVRVMPISKEYRESKQKLFGSNVAYQHHLHKIVDTITFKSWEQYQEWIKEEDFLQRAREHEQVKYPL